MADVRIYLVSGKGDILCDNCNTTQEHTIDVYWNDTTDSFDVDKTCKCQSVPNPLVPYQELFEAEMASK